MILNAGLSPALQQILVFDGLEVGEVNRATAADSCASGKVLNVGRALNCLECDATTICTIGGNTGAIIRDEFDRDGIRARWVDASGPTRICTTILDRHSGRTTELVQETAAVSFDEIEKFRDIYNSQLPQAELVVISGSFPPGTPNTLCRDLLRGSSVPAVLDIRGEPLLLALETGPLLVKPNREELAATLGMSSIADDGLLHAMRSLNHRGALWVLVTQGGGDVWLTSKTESLRFATQETEVVNPIGCGDCMTAGIAYGIHKGLPVTDAVRFGIAAATCNLRTLRPARFTLEDVEECEAIVTVKSGGSNS